MPIVKQAPVPPAPVSEPAVPVVAAVVEELPAAAPALAAEAVRYVKVRAKKYPTWHPYQRIAIPENTGVILEWDNWLEVQLAAGVLIQE